ncbi:AmmeMemoRadiSam system protein B [Proteiniborus sp. MB09-C3]|uniref:AmmeMemoRadiSam system protein B n=1 Tax=Proteiniborus sp. MB09-C3 TaxID=3050072 RepID=UPI002554CBE8|nr:AmmeMemoRadiSam system protein B [Proteiniborus sp. MB09-C3]WIV12023.1 AmmeMemoRadiSam system protein B [Proteiniborus sp. MB09-C3]
MIIVLHILSFRKHLIRVVNGMLPKMQLYRFGMCIKKAVEDSNTDAVFIASGDLSHMLTEDGPYGYSPYGEEFDDEIISLLKKGDVSGIFNMDRITIEKAAECGLRSYYVMLEAMNGFEVIRRSEV